MEDISFSIYLNNKLQNITFQDLASKRRVLICSVVRIYAHVTDTYIRQLIDQLPFYYANGIDEVYLVLSSGGTIPLARADKCFPGITSLADVNRDFVAAMKNLVGKDLRTLDELAQFWSYQALFNNGVLEQFYEQPTENYMKHLIKSGLKPGPDHQRLLLSGGDDFVLHRHLLSTKENFSNPKNLPNYEHRDEKKYPFHKCTPLEFMYFNLCPNKKLNEYLVDTRQQSVV